MSITTFEEFRKHIDSIRSKHLDRQEKLLCESNNPNKIIQALLDLWGQRC